MVWVNELGGVTCEIDGGDRRWFHKWSPAGRGPDLAHEARRLRWAAGYARVPRVLDEGADPTGTWLLTAAMPGEMAVTDRWKGDPATAVRAIGEGLRALHEALPVEQCPFTWSAAARVERAHARAEAGLLDPRNWHPEHRRLSVQQALDAVAVPPPVDAVVVCHGDSCAPNTLLDPTGRFAGHVDLGDLGVGDRWADLAIATWSTTWNYGPGWEPPLLAAYGIADDPERTRYYRLLWDLGD